MIVTPNTHSPWSSPTGVQGLGTVTAEPTGSSSSPIMSPAMFPTLYQ